MSLCPRNLKVLLEKQKWETILELETSEQREPVAGLEAPRKALSKCGQKSLGFLEELVFEWH